jgi:hypothetical protein
MRRNQQQATHSPQSEMGEQTRQSYTVQHDFHGSASVTATLVHALSTVASVDVTQVEEALCECVDPCALDSLFSPGFDGSPRTDGHVSFNIRGFQTTLYGNGLISIVPPQTQQHARTQQRV